VAVVDVVAERQRDARAADEVAADQERLRQALRLRLCRVLDVSPTSLPSSSRRRKASCSCGVVITSTSPDPRQHQRSRADKIIGLS